MTDDRLRYGAVDAAKRRQPHPEEATRGAILQHLQPAAQALPAHRISSPGQGTSGRTPCPGLYVLGAVRRDAVLPARPGALAAGICGGLASCEGKLSHLGITAPARATLAYANEHRPWQLYRGVFEALLGRCEAAAPARRRFRFKNKLVSLDSTVIELCAKVFDWAKFRRTKGAVKLHLLLDHDGFLPRVAVITDGKRSISAWPARCASSRAPSW